VDVDEHARGADKLIGFPVYSENCEACLLAAKHRERMHIGRQRARQKRDLDGKNLDANKFEKPQGFWVFIPKWCF
jgi:hypothetical protein